MSESEYEYRVRVRPEDIDRVTRLLREAEIPCVVGTELQGETVALTPIEGGLRCAKCGETEFQLVEETTVWYPIDRVTDDGVLIADVANRQVADEGETKQIECKSCLTPLDPMPEYEWE